MQLSKAHVILRLFNMATLTPYSFRKLVLCSPYISDELFLGIFPKYKTINIPLIIITRPDTAQVLLNKIKPINNLIEIISISNLHAKIYLACGNDERDSVAVIGSFNFTNSAMNKNVEFGIRINGNTPTFKQLISSIEKTLNQMARIGQKELFYE